MKIIIVFGVREIGDLSLSRFGILKASKAIKLFYIYLYKSPVCKSYLG